jgi:hypothetical protein
MPREIFPSSYECDCGHKSHFFENTIKEMKAMSKRKGKRLHLNDSEADQHVIVFYRGEMVDIICSKLTEEGKVVQKRAKRKGKGDDENEGGPNKGMHRSAKREFHNDGQLPRAR